MVLLRDHLPFGAVEKIMTDHVDKVSDLKAVLSTHDDISGLPEYCKKLAVRLSGDLVGETIRVDYSANNPDYDRQLAAADVMRLQNHK